MGVLFLGDLFTKGELTHLLELSPAAVISDHEYWRLFTYAFVMPSFITMLIASFALYLFFPELERLLGSWNFYRNAIVFLFTIGVLYCLMGNSAPNFAGPEPLVLAAMIVFAYLYPSMELSLFGIISLPAWIAVMLFIGVSVLPDLFAIVDQPQSFGAFLCTDLLGVATGIGFAHLYFAQHPQRATDRTRQVEESELNDSETTDSEHVLQVFGPRKAERRSEMIAGPANDELLNEDRLNEILDKIHLKGEASLTAAERQFLEDYSNRL